MDKRIAIFTIVLLSVLVFLFIFFNNDVNKYKSIVNKNSYVAHALGGIDNNSYTNSKEALDNSYKHGFKFFEIDIRVIIKKYVFMIGLRLIMKIDLD